MWMLKLARQTRSFIAILIFSYIDAYLIMPTWHLYPSQVVWFSLCILVEWMQ
jgi:hypothetical protein